MQVFKFGGASVKDASGVKNVASLLKRLGFKNTLIVVSAMGKTTNALERVVKAYLGSNANLKTQLKALKTYHTNILLDLFKDPKHVAFKNLNALFEALNIVLETNKSLNYNFVYDQVVGFGELISTTIISDYLNYVNIKNNWIDARTQIKTDGYYRNANVNWETTQSLISLKFNSQILNITQGFLGSDCNNFTTTLGREGSDYTAAIYAYCLNAQSVTVWKDVPGVLNADPRYFEKTQLLKTMSYREAIEFAFYGASVIHPKTLQPLQSKEIPLYVKSFLNPKAQGTKISKNALLNPLTPCFIVRPNQILIALSTLNFSFLVEENISKIFNLLHDYKMKVAVIQNSAISFQVCVSNSYDNLDKLLPHLKAEFKVNYIENVTLYTIKHYNGNAIRKIETEKTVLLKQLTPETVQIIAQN